MTRIYFYFNVANKREVISDLVLSALIKRRQVTIFTEDQNAASNVSANLWQNKQESFLPNVLANHTLAAQTPVVVHWQESQLFQDDMLINLTAIEPSFFSRFTQLIELVSGDEQDKTVARQRYKFYRDRGYEIKNIDFGQANLVVE